MSTDYQIFGYKAPTEKFTVYKAIQDNCRIANIDVPKEVDEFFCYYENYLLEQGGGECIKLTPPLMNGYEDKDCKEVDGVILEHKEGSHVVILDLEKLSSHDLKYITFGAYY